MRRRTALLPVVAALVAAAPASAELRVTKVDASRHPEVAVTLVTDRPAAGEPSLRENGVSVPGAVARNLGRSKSLVVAIDRSRSMEGDAFRQAVAAARRFVRSKSQSDRVAVTAFGSNALQLTRFASSTIDADGALRSLTVDAKEGTALYDVVALAAGLLAGEPSGGKVLVVLTDGRDVSSRASAKEAIAAANRAGVAVYAIGLESGQFSPAPLQRLAKTTGGTYRGTASPGALVAVYDAITAELRRTWSVRYYTSARPGEELRVEARVGGARAEAVATVPGERTTREPASSSLPPWLVESTAAPVAVGGAVGVLLLLASLLAFGGRRSSKLKSRLAPHVERSSGRQAAGRPERFNATAALLAATEETFGHLKVWLKVQRLIQRADLPLRAVELFYISASAALIAGMLMLAMTRAPLSTMIAAAVGGLIPLGFVAFKARRRLKALEDQLPDVLLTLAASLKAGHSFKQGVQTVVDEAQPPTSQEFQRVLGETRLGRPMDAALEEMAERVGSKNLEFVVTAVTIQTQVGGSLAGLFDMVADAIRQRQQFARKVKGLTAMGRASAYTLVGLPFFTAGLITLINPSYMEPLHSTPTGHKLIGAGLVMMAVGSLLLKRIVSFRG